MNPDTELGSMGGEPPRPKNPRRVAAGAANRQVRGPLTEAGRERLRSAAVENQPWQFATGPRTPEGKRQAAANGKTRQLGPASVREARAEAAEEFRLLSLLSDSRTHAATECGSGPTHPPDPGRNRRRGPGRNQPAPP